MELVQDETSVVDYIKRRTGERLQALIISKDRKGLFVIVKPRRPEEIPFWPASHTIGRIEVEYHPDTDSIWRILAYGGWNYKHPEGSEILFATADWDQKLRDHLTKEKP
jgi:hypothetical protein